MRDSSVLLWPDALAPAGQSIAIDRPIFKGPKPLSGREQVVQSSAGGWLISYEGVPVYRTLINQFRPIWTALAGLAQPVYVKPDFSEWSLARRKNIGATAINFSDGATFSNSSQFFSGSLMNPALWYRSAIAAPTLSSAVTPDGATTAVSLTDASTSDVVYLLRFFNVPNDTVSVYRVIVYVLKTTTAPAYGATIEFDLLGGATQIYAYVTVNPATGALLTIGSVTNLSSTLIGNFYKVQFDIQNNGTGNVNLYCVLHAALVNLSDGGAYLSGTGTSTFWSPEVYLMGAQSAPFSQSTGDCFLTQPAKRGDTAITVNNSVIAPVEAGDYIELNGRLHMVNAMDGANWSVWPPLRSSYPAGTVIEIDDPRLLAYLTTDSRAALMSADARALSRINLDFIEANW